MILILKQLIFISGVTGGILLVLRIIGLFVDFAYNDQLLAYGLILAAVCITLSSVYKQLQKYKIKDILRSYKERSLSEPAQGEARKSWRDEKTGESRQEKGNGHEGFSGEENQEMENDEKDCGTKKTKSGQKGLEPGKTSLRKRKSGLVWGGGNIKGANATRGTRKGFIKRW